LGYPQGNRTWVDEIALQRLDFKTPSLAVDLAGKGPRHERRSIWECGFDRTQSRKEAEMLRDLARAANISGHKRSNGG
jgi:hypothetical protein